MNNNILIIPTDFPLTKKGQDEVAKKVIMDISDGQYDPLLVKIQLQAIKNILETITKDKQIADLILDEAEKYEGKTFNRFGTEITITQKTTYNYKGDQIWNDLNAKLKNREKLLKSVTPENPIADAVSGELLEPPSRKISRYLRISFK